VVPIFCASITLSMYKVFMHQPLEKSPRHLAQLEHMLYLNVLSCFNKGDHLFGKPENVREFKRGQEIL